MDAEGRSRTMDEATRRTLDAFNRAFYARSAEAFDRSRDRPWAGWTRALAGLANDRPVRVLDLGCGNARLLDTLTRKTSAMSYLGIDSCEHLIARARERYQGPAIELRCADMFDARGEPALPPGSFDCVALMGVLHHVASERARRALLSASLARVAPGGRLIATVWRFMQSKRLAARVVPWPTAVAQCSLLAELQLDQLEPGDVLLRWNKGAGALRYCHAASPTEIERWLQGLPATVTRFAADGDGELNEYLVIEPR